MFTLWVIIYIYIFLWHFKLNYLFIVGVKSMHDTWVWRSGTAGIGFLFPLYGFWGTELRWLGLAESASAYWAISQVGFTYLISSLTLSYMHIIHSYHTHHPTFSYPSPTTANLTASQEVSPPTVMFFVLSVFVTEFNQGVGMELSTGPCVIRWWLHWRQWSPFTKGHQLLVTV